MLIYGFFSTPVLAVVNNSDLTFSFLFSHSNIQYTHMAQFTFISSSAAERDLEVGLMIQKP